jgi:monovalent cation:H+ antiporter-2, CPA2 family
MLCAENIEEARVLEQENIGRVYYAKTEMASNMTHHILVQMGFDEREPASKAAH